MPEYDNADQTKAVRQITIKFATENDYEQFVERLKTNFYNGEKAFDGRQRVESKTTWWPPKEKAKNWRYDDES